MKGESVVGVVGHVGETGVGVGGDWKSVDAILRFEVHLGTVREVNEALRLCEVDSASLIDKRAGGDEIGGESGGK